MNLLLLSILILCSGLLTSCQHTAPVAVAPPVETVVLPPVVVTPPTPEAPQKTYPTKGWVSEYEELIKAQVTEQMLNMPNSRMTKFCDVWPALTREERKQFYVDLVYAIAGPESAWNNLTGMIETTMGKDALTKKYPVLSEGMLQLSYQDSLWYGPKCKWDWPEDEAKLVRDIEINKGKKSFKAQAMDRSTLDPIRNITCGVAIMDYHLKRTNREFADSLGEYWYVMKRKNASSYSQVWTNLKARKTVCK